jgi:lipopolysaccharide transport system permease protein
LTYNQEKWTTVISPRRGWLDINFKELWHYRDLVLLFVRRDFVTFYKQTILGPLWFLLQPIFHTIIFTVIFGKIAKIPTDGLPQPLFYLSGIVVWNYFASCLTGTSNTFVTNANIFGKVYFPRLAVPISIAITNLMTFVIQFILFLFILSFFYLKGAAVRPNFYILLTPLLILQMGILGLGFGILVSSLTTKYRDLAFVTTFGIQLWMYVTPIVYPISQVPERWRWLFVLNPTASIIETFRYAFLGTGSVKSLYVIISIGVTLAVLSAGVVLFNRVEKTFMDKV